MFDKPRKKIHLFVIFHPVIEFRFVLNAQFIVVPHFAVHLSLLIKNLAAA